MENAPTDISNSTHLAKRLEVEISRRHLLPGDRFMTAVEAGHVLGVSRATADRAMSVLARREVLQRRRALGTFVGPNARSAKKVQTRMVYVLFPEIFTSQNSHLNPGLIMDGIRQQIPDANVQFCFFPQENALAHVREQLDQSYTDGTLAGVVAISCPDEIYVYLAQAGMPTVVFGSLHQGNSKLVSIDQDNRQAGRLLTKHLLDHGHRRMALVTVMDGRPGDHEFFDGISEVLSEAELPHNSLVVRVVNSHGSGAKLAIGRILDAPDPPTGIIIRHQHFAQILEEAAAERGLAIPGDIEIVRHAFNPDNIDKHTCVRPTVNEDEIAKLIGESLKKQNQSLPVKAQKTVIPVELALSPLGTQPRIDDSSRRNSQLHGE